MFTCFKYNLVILQPLQFQFNTRKKQIQPATQINYHHPWAPFCLEQLLKINTVCNKAYNICNSTYNFKIFLYFKIKRTLYVCLILDIIKNIYFGAQKWFNIFKFSLGLHGGVVRTLSSQRESPGSNPSRDLYVWS